MMAGTSPAPITAILSALAEEQAGLLEQLQTPQLQTLAGREFWSGQLHGQQVVLALSRIGKVAAATTSAALIERFGASAIVFTGVAGGLAPGVKVGDVVVAQDFLQHDLDAVRGQLAGATAAAAALATRHLDAGIRRDGGAGR